MKKEHLKYLACPKCDRDLKISQIKEEDNGLIKNGQFDEHKRNKRYVFFKDYVYPVELPSRVKLIINKLEKERVKFKTAPNYFCRRAKEFQHIVNSQIFNRRLLTILEIGCGTAFICALLSKYAESVVGIDLEEKNNASHSIGLEIPRLLISSLHINNVDIKTGIAEAIPLDDGSVDLVYSHFVFEHIVNHKLAFKEINRILKKDARMITIIPTLGNRVNWFFRYIFTGEIIKNYLRPLYKLVVKKCSWKESFKDFFFLIPPHDRRFSFLQECRQYRITAWKKTFIENGHNIEKIIPIRPDSIAFVTRFIKPPQGK